jgi:hypothetical protein
MEIRTMSDEQRRAIALEYLRRLRDFFDIGIGRCGMPPRWRSD